MTPHPVLTSISYPSVAYRVASTVAVVMAPDLLRLGAPFWTLSHAAQAPLLGLGFVAALWLAGLGGSDRLRRLAVGLAVVGLVGACVFAVASFAPSLPLVRSSALFALLLGAVLLVCGELAAGSPRILWGTSIVLLAAVGAYEWRLVALPQDVSKTPRIVFTIYQPLQLTDHGRQVAEADVHRGGGLARAGDRMLVMTGSGAMYELNWDGGETPMRGARLALPSPVDFGAFEPSLISPPHPEMVRAQAVLVREQQGGWQFFVSHHAWNDDGRCITMAISTASMDATLERVTSGWSVLARATPCLPFGDSVLGGNFAGHLSGGQLAFLSADTLLWTLGDHGLDLVGRPEAGSQRDDYDYGKTRRVDVGTGEIRPFAKGQRNPQGLYVAPDGRIWATEQGPRGGDELNLVLEDHNYGWPYATYGTDYGQLVWPPSQQVPAGSVFTGPTYAWLPSVATTALIGIESPLFGRWKDNLMVASLAGRALHRLALEGDRVVYSERIPIGEEIRDLIEGPGGSLWLWNDRGIVLTLRPAPPEDRGAFVMDACTGCHAVDPDSPPVGRGPSLVGIVNRAVASDPAFPTYSPALRAVGGRWTPERLQEYLADPVAFAPGTTMNYSIVTREDREALVAFMQSR